MATFPAIEPAGRSYDFGVFPLTEQPSLSAGIVRFRHATTPTNYNLELQYSYITEAEITLIRQHYENQAGTYRSFQLPSIIWKGHTFTGNVFPVGTRWRYADAPEETHHNTGRYSITIPLVSDGAYESQSFEDVAVNLAPGTAFAPYGTLEFDPVEVSLASGAGSGNVPYLIGSFINSDATADTSHVLNVPTHAAGDLLVAVLMWRNDKGTLTVPSGWTLQGTYTSSIVISGAVQNLLVYTKTASSSEPASYTWSATTSTRNCGLMASIRNGVIDTVTENYGNAATATIATVAARLNLTVFTWVYANVSPATESYSQSGTGLTQITDSPKVNARMSGGYTILAGTVTSTHQSATADNSPNHGGINIRLKIP